MSWATTWRLDTSVRPLEEGTRGHGERRGRVGLAEFKAGWYPACSLHGSLIRVGKEPAIWRCFVRGCNAGAITQETRWSDHDPYGYPRIDRWYSALDNRRIA